MDYSQGTITTVHRAQVLVKGVVPSLILPSSTLVVPDWAAFQPELWIQLRAF